MRKKEKKEPELLWNSGSAPGAMAKRTSHCQGRVSQRSALVVLHSQIWVMGEGHTTAQRQETTNHARSAPAIYAVALAGPIGASNTEGI